MALDLCTGYVSTGFIGIKLESEPYGEAGQRTRLITLGKIRKPVQQLPLRQAHEPCLALGLHGVPI